MKWKTETGNRKIYEAEAPRAAALKIANAAPCGSAITEMRPTSSKSVGGMGGVSSETGGEMVRRRCGEFIQGSGGELAQRN